MIMTRAALIMAMCLVASVSADFDAPREVINLDLPASQRWVAFTAKYKDRTAPALDYLKQMAGSGTVLHPIVEALRKAMLSGGGWSEEHIAEMKSIADGCGEDEDVIQMANLYYEFGTLGAGRSLSGCTSIVAQTANGTIIHARNQDYSMPGLSNITVTVEFRRGGKVAYVGETFAGYIGLPTALRPGGWSVSCDSRFKHGLDLLDNVKAAQNGGKTIGLMVRDMLETAATYEDAIRALNTTLVVAPAYYIVAGTKTGEGAVVTRDRDQPDESHGEGIWSIGDGTKAPGSWWRLETNWDHWSAAADGRREAANRRMAKIPRAAVDMQALLGVLSEAPVLASDTVYTAMMWPAAGSAQAVGYRSVVREHAIVEAAV